MARDSNGHNVVINDSKWGKKKDVLLFREQEAAKYRGAHGPHKLHNAGQIFILDQLYGASRILHDHIPETPEGYTLKGGSRVA